MKHIVGFSGGIDSQAAARWVINRYGAGNVILLNSNAGGNEHPLTTECIARYSREIHPVLTVEAIVADLWRTDGFAESKGLDGNALLDFPKLIELRGPPTRTRRTCTEFLKNAPQKRWMSEQAFDDDYERYTGLRRDESKNRASTPPREWDSYFDCWLNHPIFDWTKKMCFEYVQAHDGFFNELYTMGFDRVGCAPCILSGKEDIANWAIRFPEMIAKVGVWEERTGKTFFMSKVPGLKAAPVNEMVRWAMSSRGGRQDLFPIMHEREACESKYGLCE